MKVEKVTRRKSGAIDIDYTDDNGKNIGLILGPETIVNCWMKAKLKEGETFGTYINRRIEEIFNDLAGEAGELFAKTLLPDDIPVGALAFELMAKSIRLQEAWKKITEEENEQVTPDLI